jgi:WD40 repeat protein
MWPGNFFSRVKSNQNKILLIFLTLVLSNLSLEVHSQHTFVLELSDRFVFDGTDITDLLWNETLQRILVWGNDTITIAHLEQHLNNSMKTPGMLIGTMMNRNATHIFAWWHGGTSVYVWNSGGHFLYEIQHPAQVIAVELCCDEYHVLSASLDGTIYRWNLEGTIEATLTHFEPGEVLDGFRWSPENTKLSTWSHPPLENLAHSAGTVKVWNTEAQLQADFHFAEPVREIVWCPGSQYFLTLYARTIYLVNIEERRLIALKHDNTVMDALCHPDTGQILSWSDHTARLWNNAGELLASLNHDGRVEYVDWSHDYQKILTTSADATLKVWTARGEPVASMKHATDTSLPFDPVRIPWATWSRDDKHILSMSNHFEFCRGEQCLFAAWLWSSTGELEAIFQHRDLIVRPAWNFDETLILTGSRDGTVKIWKTDGELIATIPEENRQRSGLVDLKWSSLSNRFLVWYENGIVEIFDLKIN